MRFRAFLEMCHVQIPFGKGLIHIDFKFENYPKEYDSQKMSWIWDGFIAKFPNEDRYVVAPYGRVHHPIMLSKKEIEENAEYGKLPQLPDFWYEVALII